MARSEWKAGPGRCAVCGKRGLVQYHHVVLRQHVEREGGDPWDFRNAMPVGKWMCRCHDGHHHPGVRNTRIPHSKLTAANREFAAELMGTDRAEDYLRRFYGAEEQADAQDHGPPRTPR